LPYRAGRTPYIDNVTGGCVIRVACCYKCGEAGGGVKLGHILGKSDKIAGTVAERTGFTEGTYSDAFHLLGIDPENACCGSH